MSKDKVVFLAFDNPNVKTTDALVVIACKNCGNKTWVIVIDSPNAFPLVKCCVCGVAAARMGWIHDEGNSPA